MNNEELQDVLKALKACQEAEHDMREQSREAHEFVIHRQGQWEPQWYSQNEGKPRYTFDLTGPIIDQVSGYVEKQDFSTDVSPMGGDASEEVSETLSGLIRNIENMSRAQATYNRATRESVTGGISGWRVIQKYAQGDSFDQDLAIERIGSYVDRVWLGPHEEPDGSDAKYGFVLAGMPKDDFEAKYPDAKPSEVATDRVAQSYYHRHDLVTVGEYLYLAEEDREIVLMSNGQVFDAEALAMVADELAQAGIMEEGRRTRKKRCVYSRLFSENEWLTEPRKTVFEEWIPIIPLYGNFEVYEDKVTYRGEVEKLMDPQRVFNYSLSREIEEGALAPRAKYWMTENQAEGYEKSLASLNTNSDPVQFYNPDPEAPPPAQQGGAQINPGLRNISESMRMIIGQSAGMFAANMGDTQKFAQSGVAIEALQDRGDTGSTKYTEAREIAQAHTARILVDAIPRVYGPKRQIRILGEDGTQEFVTIGQTVMDQQTGAVKVLNDLAQGQYDVTCKSGPSFKNRQNETVSTLVELGKVDPSVIQLGGDILANNVTAPGMGDLADRKRQILFKQGLIPLDQLTDEEKQQVQAAATQPPQENPQMVLARAEEAKAQADAMAVQQKVQESNQQHQVKIKELSIREYEAQIKAFEAQIAAQEAGMNVKLKGAQAAKTLAEAEATDIESELAVSNVAKLMEGVAGGAN